ncbi:4-aminobutyrate--2-oxoglutarate transaminase [Azohydromonas sp.]|uniref:4-aminobutyrate--2-oxoglutarate transaminase n=1 Tax=Azohydromonas sp. TaxID=1872666 RepID=UPI002C39EC6A|nr:4-aminobutyrate--2-oxoglutarate transaminase [Azohydromonas sp.]HMM85998.1 4-aminobutyrate--2-oxoglutarate transaminase [Azohydromonas sp.]
MNHSRNEQLMARKAAATPRGVGVMGAFFAERAQGAELWDVEGRRYIDFAGGIAVMNVGHGHPKVLAAIQAQLERFSHTCYQVVPYEGYVSLAEKLNRLTPGTHAKKTAFFSTGAEAVENAVKIARAHTRRSGVIAFGGAFHGRSLFAVSLTGKVQPYKAGFGPFPPEIYHAPFPCHGASLEDTRKAVHHLFKADIEPGRVAAIVFEPVQGEGGFNVIRPEAVAWLRELCDEHGIVLIADEVQTGFGRTGRMFAMEHYGVAPDLMTIAKSLAAGLPLSAVTGRAEIMDAPAAGGLGGTYAGNPLAVAAAHAVIDVMADERLPERGARLGERLRAELDAARAEVPQIADVRGLGGMVAVELRRPDGAPDAEFTRCVQAQALQRGLILLTCGVDANVVRFLFPLTVPEAVFDEALAILRDALRAA